MKIKKTTDKYMFYQEGDYYVLNLGAIKKGEDTTTTLLFEDLEDSSKFRVEPTCGCTVVARNILNKTTVSCNVAYEACSSSFSKNIICNSNGKQFSIKIKGTCQ